MRIIYPVIIAILLFGTAAVAQAQEKPLTQAEYVQLLYVLEKSPGKHDEIVEAIRKRGIGFVLTDGLKSLTASKSKNDVALRRTLEEAARRKDDPAAYQLPGEKESKDVLNKAREATLAAVDEMPDFLVKQVILRSISYAGTNNFTPTDRLVVAVGYRASGQEEYRLLSVNGVPQAEVKGKGNGSYEDVGGTTSAGEFVTILKTIFKPENQTRFEPVDTDVLLGERAIVYSFEIARDLAKQRIVFARDIEQETISGMKGKIWIDRDKFRVLRVESQATEIPDSFPVRAASRNVDYDWVTINNQKYLLPTLSEVRLTQREKLVQYESRNEIRFREYRKFDVDIKIVDDDEPAETEAPPKKP
jgi:hypothetical protein